MKTCGTCRHFFEDSPHTPYGTCEGIPFYDGYGEEQGNLGDDDLKDPNAPLAFVVDGSGYYGALAVSEEFGCLLHKPK